MKRIKTVNGYAIYQAQTQRDADNYGCQIGNYNLYVAQDIRDFGLTNSYPEFDDIDSLAAAIELASGSNYAVASALADELSDSTIQDMDLILELERRLDADETIEYIRDCYDEETGRLFATPQEAEAARDDAALADGPDGDLEDVFEEAMEEAALLDWELSAIEIGDYMIAGDQAWKVTSMDHGTGEWRFTVESPNGESYCVDAEAAGRARFIGRGADWADKRHVAELWSGHEIASHASYYVVESDGDCITATVNFNRNWYESNEAWLDRRRYAFLRAVAERYAFNDCSDDHIVEIVYDGCRIEYAGWQPGMLIEFREASTGLVVFSESFPEWDH